MCMSITLNGTCLHPFSFARLFNTEIPWELEITKAEVSLLSLNWWTIIADTFSYVAAFLCRFHWHCVSLFELRKCSCCLSVGALRVEGIQESLTLPFDPSLPPFLAFSLIFKGPSTPHKEPLFHTAVTQTVDRRVFWAHLPCFRQVFQLKSFNCVFSDLVCTVL